MKTKSKVSAYILRGSVPALFFSFVIVALSSAINPKFPTSKKTAFGVNEHGSPPSGVATRTPTPMGVCMPNDYTITTGSGTIVPGITDTGNHCDDCITPIALPFPVTFYDQTFFSVKISSNGNLQFTDANDSPFGACLPYMFMSDLIAPYWADLYAGDADSGLSNSYS